VATGGAARKQIVVRVQADRVNPCVQWLARLLRDLKLHGPLRQLFLLVGGVFIVLIILGYTAWAYCVFRGEFCGGGWDRELFCCEMSAGRRWQRAAHVSAGTRRIMSRRPALLRVITYPACQRGPT
jgi:hypothetical protein